LFYGCEGKIIEKLEYDADTWTILEMGLSNLNEIEDAATPAG